MKDWKAIARANGIEIPARDLERVASALDALEEAFRPLAGDLAPDLEPALELRMDEGDE